MAPIQAQQRVSLVSEGLLKALGVHAHEIQDPDQFLRHMARYHKALGGPLTRVEYESICLDLGITPASDAELDPQQMECGDFGGSIYHVNPRNRTQAIARTLQQRRWWQISIERAAKLR